MRIRIKDTAICDNCTKKTCSSGDVIEKNTFAKFRSERYTCPIRLFQYGPTDKQLDEGYIDISFGADVICNFSALNLMCVIQCFINILNTIIISQNISFFHKNNALA